MDSFLQRPAQERRLAFVQAEDKKGLQAASVEKDFWVCWVLHELLLVPGVGGHLTFKGGTSLSKVWGLIERFSEDIDLTIDKEALGFGGEKGPDCATGINERKRRLNALVEASRDWIQKVLQPGLSRRIEDRMNAHLPGASWKLETDPDVADGQTLLFTYPSVFGPADPEYLRPVVKIELGARSDDWPSEKREIKSYVAELFPAMAPEATVLVATLAAERTFWEKACLLHEETFRPADKRRQIRMARHYYDLWCLITKGISDRALADQKLFNRVVEHRSVFFRHNWVDYDTHRPGTFRLVPQTGQEADWRKDYEAMRGPMFYGQVPEFDEILKVVKEFEQRFNKANPQ